MRYLTGGESHGPCLTAIVEGMPAGLNLSSGYINRQLHRRQQGYGRGGRMKLESDQVNFLSGLRFGQTTGSPLSLQIVNRDADNWKQTMAAEGEPGPEVKAVNSPRPGHADYAGGIKYGRHDLRDVLERSSARETAIRVAVGSVARCLLEEMNIHVYSHVISIGNAGASECFCNSQANDNNEESDSKIKINDPEVYSHVENSPLRCINPQDEEKMKEEIDSAREKGDTVGGVWEIMVTGVPVGLGSHVQSDRKLDGMLAGALMSLQGVKGVEIGWGFQAAKNPGSQVHDPFNFDPDTGEVSRPTNRAGGIEGGISNGQPLIIKVAMKPIPTLLNPLPSIDLATGQESLAAVERSDVCAVPAASVVSEAIVAWELAVAMREKFGGDSMEEMLHNYKSRRV